jgi:hypothetical protein
MQIFHCSFTIRFGNGGEVNNFCMAGEAEANIFDDCIAARKRRKEYINSIKLKIKKREARERRRTTPGRPVSSINVRMNVNNLNWLFLQ